MFIIISTIDTKYKYTGIRIITNYEGSLFDMKGKTIADSAVIMSSVMQPNQANPSGNVHGGEIMKLMDNAAYVVSHKHSRNNVVTARVDELTFHEPIYVGNLVTCEASLTFVGKSSMEVHVKVFVEDLFREKSKRCALTAFFTMVAINQGGVPIPVSHLELTTNEEKSLFEQGKKRYESYKVQPETKITSS